MTNRSIRNGWLSFIGALAVICALTVFIPWANAQVVSGSLVGNVTDASGSAIPGATIKITQTQTNDSRSVETNELGGYTIATVTPGNYLIEITKEGFRSSVSQNVLVNPNNVVRVD